MNCEHLNAGVLLHRSRARTNDLLLRILTAEGAVLALYVRNGRGSQRRLAGLEDGFGISEIRWTGDIGTGTGNLLAIESHIRATWLQDTRAYTWYSALVETLAHELQPGMLDTPLASMMFQLLRQSTGPTGHDFVRALSLLGHCQTDTVASHSILTTVRNRLGIRAPYLQLALGVGVSGLESA